MPTLPHQDTENGYSLRVSKNLPKNAANLAYVYADTPSTEKNLLVDDYSNQIAENKITSGQKQLFKVFSKSDMELESEEGMNTFFRSDIEITDEYDVFSKGKEPLFYKAEAKGLFDARYSRVFPYLGGNAIGQEKRFEELSPLESSQIIYKEDKIFITKEKGIPLDEDSHYKIKLVKSGELNYTYKIIIYSNFRYIDLSYEIHYKESLGEKIKDRNEILNFTPLFEKVPLTELQTVSDSDKLTIQKYAVEGDSEHGYKVYAPSPSLSLSDINMKSRPAHTFKYLIESNLETRISDKNPEKLNVGLIYINETAFNQRNVSSAAKKLFHKNKSMPDYFTFDNPHRLFGINFPEQYDYWLADLTMPKEHYLDYDVLIISGYGFKDFTKYVDSLKAFLNNGGTLIYDNCGSGVNVLNSVNSSNLNTFINNISFSKTENSNKNREFGTNIGEIKNRYYDLNTLVPLGEVSPVIAFTGQEVLNDWDVLINHQSEGPSVAQKKTGYKGKLIISNAGLMLDILLGNETTMKFMVNLMIRLAEKRYFKTPYFKDYVYHRDNLFEKEYKGLNNEILYVDDRHDLDETQIVAKKIINQTVFSKAKEFLRNSYLKATGRYTISSIDEGVVEINNARFEQASLTEENSWSETKLNAIPGWDVVKFAGTGVEFKHQTTDFKEGSYSIKIKTVNAQAFWETNLGVLPAGEYTLSSWIKSNETSGGGIAVYTEAGVLMFKSEEVEGTSTWKQLSFSFKLTTAQELLVRLGAHDANKNIDISFDDITLKNEGSVRMTLPGDGNEMLYAYATSPKGEGLDLAYQSFKTENIAQENVILNTKIIVKSFVYQWVNEDAVYKKKYGNSETFDFSISLNENKKTLGKLMTFLPPLADGIEWADKTRVYYEITPVDSEENKYINYELYDPTINKYFFNSEGTFTINYNDLWWNSIESTVVLRASTSYYGLKLLNRSYNLKINERKNIEVLEPATKDERDRWYLRIKNGSFLKRSISSKDLENLKEVGREDYYDDKLIGTHEYTIPEYDKQAFYPIYGERKIIAERAEYIDDRNIRVQRQPLQIREEDVVKEQLVPINVERTVFQSRNNWWKKDVLPTIYWDELSNGNDSVLKGGFKIDYDEGIVDFRIPESAGKNLVLNSSAYDVYPKMENTPNWKTNADLTFKDEGLLVTAKVNEGYYQPLDGTLTDLHGFVPGETYTISLDVKSTVGFQTSISYYWNPQNSWLSSHDFLSITNEYQRISRTITIPLGTKGFILRFMTKNLIGSNINIKNIKVEKGETETEYTVNPLDIEPIIAKGIVKASYSQDNFKIFKRNYSNQRIQKELLTSRDNYTFHSENTNWMVEPQATIYRADIKPENIVNSKKYYIDYENGNVVFFEETPQRIYVDYGFFTEEELIYKDVDVYKGQIKLDKEISFKDEIYISYIYQENYLEYKGYYDSSNNRFVHLDLNPTVGHTFSIRQEVEGLTEYEEIPTEKLLGKEIFVYLLPSKSTFNTIKRTEENCVRHCLSEEEWKKVKESNVTALLLSKIQVRENTSVENVVVIDSRKAGGGLKETISQAEIEEKVGYTSNFWDIGAFDGTAYYRNGVLILRIPSYVLKINGGMFDEDDVEEIVEKYVSFGNMPIIEYIEKEIPLVEKEEIEPEEIPEQRIVHRNLFIKKNSTIGYLDSDGDISLIKPPTNLNEITSEKIKVNPLSPYRMQVWMKGVPSAPEDQNYGRIRFMYLDKEDKLIETIAFNSDKNTKSTKQDIYWNISSKLKFPLNCESFKFAIRTFDSTNIKFEAGTLLTDWSLAPEDVEE